MNAQEFRSKMLEYANNHPEIGRKSRMAWRALAAFEIMASAGFGLAALTVEYPMCFFVSVMAAAFLIKSRIAIQAGDAQMRLWLRMRQDTLDDMERELRR